jgi:formate dehydrogenase major subunit
VTAVEVRRTNYFSEWQERNLEEEISLRKIAQQLPTAAE